MLASHKVGMRDFSSMQQRAVHGVVGVVLAHQDSDVRNALTRALAEVEAKVAVRCFDDGLSCLAYLQDMALPRGEPGPRLLLLGFDMPGLDGMGLLQRLRQGQARRGLPVVMTGTAADVGRVRPAYEAGANSCLLLPDDPAARAVSLSTVLEYWTRVVVGPALEAFPG